MPDSLQMKPRPASFFMRVGLGVVIGVFGGLALWSVAAPIDSAVIATGQVVVESNRKTIQHLEGGVIGEIFVREGQLVDEGEVLVRLDSTVYGANLSLIDSQLTELYARRARLVSERDGADAVVDATGLEAVLARSEFAAVFSGQQRLFHARRATKTRQISLLEERIVQQEKRINGYRSEIASVTAQLKLIRDELESIRELYEKGFAPLTRLRALERESERLSGQRGSLNASVAEADSIASEARLEIERLREAAREEAIAELRDTAVSIAELEERRVTAADALSRTEVRAPQSGRVIGLAVHTVGGVIGPGVELMEIVPEGDRLEVAARVSPSDIDKVRAGQDAVIRFSAFGVRSTPEADGRVRHVSADSLTDQVTGAPYYLVLIDLPEPDELSELLRGEPLVPGMPTDAFIRTGKRPAISYLLRPLTDALARSMRED